MIRHNTLATRQKQMTPFDTSIYERRLANTQVSPDSLRSLTILPMLMVLYGHLIHAAAVYAFK
ncbi:hypothetical protein BDV10DRAFT_167772 [Aspergillus recurvatus]